MGGGAMIDGAPLIRLKASFAQPSPSSYSSSYPCHNFPVSANNSNAEFLGQSHTVAFCPCSDQSCRKHEFVSRREKRRDADTVHDPVLEPAPLQFEVESAITALQDYLRGISSAGSDFNQLQQILGSRDITTLIPHGYGRLGDAVSWLQTDPSFKRLVVSLSTDRAIWEAVMNNQLVRKLQVSRFTAENGRPRSTNEEPDLVMNILRWIMEIIKAKVMELIDKFQSLMNEVLQPVQKANPHAETIDNLKENVGSSLLLTVVILLIVVVARAQSI